MLVQPTAAYSATMGQFVINNNSSNNINNNNTIGPTAGVMGHSNTINLSSSGGTAAWPPARPTIDTVTYTSLSNGSVFSIPKSWSQESTDQVLVTVYRFIKSFVGASGAAQGTIDNRIEQAMDLVKSHLMSAVRSEVEELRDKISKLEDTVSLLSRENELLRANCSPDILSNLAVMGGGRGGGHPLPAPGDTPHSQQH